MESSSKYISSDFASDSKCSGFGVVENQLLFLVFFLTDEPFFFAFFRNFGSFFLKLFSDLFPNPLLVLFSRFTLTGKNTILCMALDWMVYVCYSYNSVYKYL